MATRAWAEKDGFLINAGLSALGLRHGVTTRKLGNMKDESCRRDAAARLGLPEPLTLKQVHGQGVELASSVLSRREGLRRDGSWPISADGWTLDVQKSCVGVYAADCVPFYLWSKDGRIAGVYHAGWRGLAGAMIQKAISIMVHNHGVPAGELCGAVGPHIGACCYKVGPEFEQRFPGALERRQGELFLDMSAYVRLVWKSAGDIVPALNPENLATDAPCTSCNPDLFYSFRRDKQDARMLALLSLERWPS